MAQVTWLGEGSDGPKEIKYDDIVLKPNEAVEVKDDAAFLPGMRDNKYFKVEESAPKVNKVPPKVGEVPKPRL